MRRRDFVKAIVAATATAKAALGQQTAAPVAPSALLPNTNDPWTPFLGCAGSWK